LFSGQGGVGLLAHFGHLGSSPGEAISEVLHHPLSALSPLGDPMMLRSVFFWAASFGVIPVLFGVKWLVPSLPMLAIPILGSWAPADWYFEHYWHVLLVLAAFAAVDGIVRLRASTAISTAILVLPALLVWALFGPLVSTLPDAWRVEVKGPDPDAQSVEQEVPPLEYVVLPLHLTPNLSLRPAIAFFPRPFSCTGVENLLPSIPAYREGGPPEVVVATSVWPGSNDPVWAALRAAYVPTAVSGPYEVWRLRDGALALEAMVDCPTPAPQD
jgi:hypothetical protein